MTTISQQGSTAARGAGHACSAARRSSIRAAAGPPTCSLSRTTPSPTTRTRAMAWTASRSAAPAAMGTWATSSTTARHPVVCATASTRLRWPSRRTVPTAPSRRPSSGPAAIGASSLSSVPLTASSTPPSASAAATRTTPRTTRSAPPTPATRKWSWCASIPPPSPMPICSRCFWAATTPPRSIARAPTSGPNTARPCSPPRRTRRRRRAPRSPPSTIRAPWGARW